MAAALPVPSEFGRYSLLQQIGEGGMGSVYLALDRQLDRRVALKIPHFKAIENNTVIERFYREARTAARIEHPNICRVYDVGAHNGVHYLTMEFVEGTPLSKMLSPEHPWPLFNAAALLRKIALAVQVLHTHSVIHRDLKPSNVLLRPNGEPVLMDFGLARSFQEGSERLTGTGEFMGTPAYMSPEQAKAEGNVELGPSTDIYSLGVILYEMVTGHLPFKGNTTQILVQLVTDLVRIPSARNPQLPPAFDQLCLKALAKQPEARYASAQAFADALLPFLTPTTAGVQGPATVGAGGTLAEATPPPGVVPVTRPPAGAVATLNTGLVNSEAATISGGPQPVSSAIPLSLLPDPPRARGLPVAIGLTSMIGVVLLLWTWSLHTSAQYTPHTASEDEDALGNLGLQSGSKADLQSVPWGMPMQNSVHMSLQYIAKGKFAMGSPAMEKDRHDDEGIHEVEITHDFYIGAHEVTQAEFLAVMGRNPAGFHGKHLGGPTHPVENVTWEEARVFCEKLSSFPNEQKAGLVYRLPTEAEWEYACRAGATDSYPTPLTDYAWFRDNSAGHSHPVGRKQPNARGLYDMHGNVWEWCGDYYRADTYSQKPRIDPPGPEFGEGRVLRGGSWHSTAAECRSARRYNDTGAVRDIYIGFRVVAVRK